MSKIIGVTEFQRRIGEYIRIVVDENIRLVITRRGNPEAVLIPYKTYLAFKDVQEREVQARFDQVWDRLAEANANRSQDEMAADIGRIRGG